MTGALADAARPGDAPAMARGATIYRAVVELSNVDRGTYAELKPTLALHPSETEERMLVRLLAYALRYDESLSFGKGVSTPDEPDVMSRDGAGRFVEWIEVGQPEGKRLVKACRAAERVNVFAFGRGAERWREGELAKVDAPANLGVCHLADEFLASLGAELERSLRWSLTVSEGALFLTTGERTLETTPERWIGDPLAAD